VKLTEVPEVLLYGVPWVAALHVLAYLLVYCVSGVQPVEHEAGAEARRACEDFCAGAGGVLLEVNARISGSNEGLDCTCAVYDTPRPEESP